MAGGEPLLRTANSDHRDDRPCDRTRGPALRGALVGLRAEQPQAPLPVKQIDRGRGSREPRLDTGLRAVGLITHVVAHLLSDADVPNLAPVAGPFSDQVRQAWAGHVGAIIRSTAFTRHGARYPRRGLPHSCPLARLRRRQDDAPRATAQPARLHRATPG